MKLSLNTDFTKFPRAVSVAPAGNTSGAVAGKAVLPHDERHLRRRAIELTEGTVEGGKVLVDLLEPVTLNDGDRLVLEDGRQIEIAAAPEELYDIRARDSAHLAAAIEAGRILVLRDHVIKAMLEGLGATVTDVVEPFSPMRGAHFGHSHDHHDHGHHDHDHHDHGHDHHDHGHGHGERDAYGRLPDDPHYGHNHA